MRFKNKRKNQNKATNRISERSSIDLVNFLSTKKEKKSKINRICLMQKNKTKQKNT